jgi:hypothetical protein
MKAYCGNGGISPLIFNLGTSFTPRSLYSQGKSPCYPFDRRLGGAPEPFSERGREEKNSQLPPGIKPRTPTVHPVA